MILRLKALDQNNSWAVLSEHEIQLSECSIPAQSLTSINYFNVEGRTATCSFNTSDTEIIGLLISSLNSYIHSVSDDLTTIQGEIYDEVLDKIVFTGFLGSFFDYDDYYQTFENIEIYDSVQMLIKYWLPWCYDSSIYRVIGTTFDSLLSASLFDNDYWAIPESQRINNKMFPYEIIKRYQDNLQIGQNVQDLLLTTLDIFLDWQDGMTEEEFYADAYISNAGDPFNNQKFYVRKSNMYLIPIGTQSAQLNVCLYEYTYHKTTVNYQPGYPFLEYISEKIQVQTYIINSYGEIELDINTDESNMLTLIYGDQSEDYGEMVYNNRVSSSSRLYDTYYLNSGFIEAKNPLLASFSGDSVAAIPGDWNVFFTGTAFLNTFTVGWYPKNIDVLKGLLLSGNIGMFSSLSGEIIFDNKFRSVGASIYLDIEEVRSRYIREETGSIDEKDLDVFENNDQVIGFIRKSYLPEISKANKTKEFITQNGEIEIGSFIYIGSKIYYILKKDLYANYPFTTYKGKGNS